MLPGFEPEYQEVGKHMLQDLLGGPPACKAFMAPTQQDYGGVAGVGGGRWGLLAEALSNRRGMLVCQASSCFPIHYM